MDTARCAIVLWPLVSDALAADGRLGRRSDPLGVAAPVRDDSPRRKQDLYEPGGPQRQFDEAMPTGIAKGPTW